MVRSSHYLLQGRDGATLLLDSGVLSHGKALSIAGRFGFEFHMAGTFISLLLILNVCLHLFPLNY